MPDIVGNPMDYFHVGQQVQGNSAMESFVNSIVQRWNEKVGLGMQAQAKGMGAEQETLGQLRAYASPEAQAGINALYGGGSPSGGGVGGGGAMGEGGPSFITKITRKTPVGELTREFPQAEAQKNRIVAEQQAEQPLSSEQTAQFQGKMIRFNPFAPRTWDAASVNDPTVRALLHNVPQQKVASQLWNSFGSKYIRHDQMIQILNQTLGKDYVDMGLEQESGRHVGKRSDGSQEYLD